MPLSRALGHLGDSVLRSLGSVGAATGLLARALGHVLTLRFKLVRVIDGLYTYGWRSIPVVTLAALFVGMGLAIGVEVELRKYGVSQNIANVIVISIVRELGPILTALLLAGRAGSGITAELGSMTITDQVHAMKMLGLDVMRHFVAPMIIATTISTFVMTLIFDAVGILGGYVIAVFELGIPFHTYHELTKENLSAALVISSGVKALAFGVIVGWSGTFHGLAVRGGGRGLGVATTRAVVAASFAILVSNFFLTRALTYFLESGPRP